MLIELLGCRLLAEVTKDRTHDITKGGILIPDIAKPKSRFGRVLAVSPGEWRIAGEKWDGRKPAVGDRIMFFAHAGVEITYSGDDCRILTADEVFAIMPEEMAAKKAG